jgi:regulator of replication initiation timing
MDKRQLIDQIGVIDLQISQLREQMRPVRGERVEGDRMKLERIQQEVQQLVDRKAELRVELARA